MSNERLRAALLEQGLTPEALAIEAGFDPKTVERWINGRKPHRRHRHMIATRLGLSVTYLWPEATEDQVVDSPDSEIISIYAHRSEVPRDTWKHFFESAEREIGLLVYAGVFLAEDDGIQRVLLDKAESGVQVRVLLGDPDSPEVARRSSEEGIDGPASVETRVRRALHGFEALRQSYGAEIRLHRTTLYNSIYIADDQLMVNNHIYGKKASQAPLCHLKKTPSGTLTDVYLTSFTNVWDSALATEES